MNKIEEVEGKIFIEPII